MKRGSASIACIVAVARLSYAGSSWCPSFTHLVDMKTGSDTIGVTPQQAKQILDFVRTIPGINHHVEFVDALKWPEVTVQTGPHDKLRGDFLRLRFESSGHWQILEKSKWNWKDAAK